MKVGAEIILTGLVQGVGFRYFVLRKAEELGIKGYVKNLFSGEVYATAEGEKVLVEEFFNELKIGPRSASVKSAKINWREFKNEFSTFEIQH